MGNHSDHYLQLLMANPRRVNMVAGMLMNSFRKNSNGYLQIAVVRKIGVAVGTRWQK